MLVGSTRLTAAWSLGVICTLCITTTGSAATDAGWVVLAPQLPIDLGRRFEVMLQEVLDEELERAGIVSMPKEKVERFLDVLDAQKPSAEDLGDLTVGFDAPYGLLTIIERSGSSYRVQLHRFDAATGEQQSVEEITRKLGIFRVLRKKLRVLLAPPQPESTPLAATPDPVPPPSTPRAASEPVAPATPPAEPPKAKSGWMGISHTSLTSREAKQFGLERPYGAIIKAVKPGKASALAGVQPSDVILSYNRQRVASSSSLMLYAGKARVGERITLKIWRQGREQEIVLIPQEAEPEKSAPAAAAAIATVAEPEPEVASVSELRPSESVVDIDPNSSQVTVTSKKERRTKDGKRQIIHETLTVGASDDGEGVGASYQQEVITEVTRPVDSVWIGTYSAGGVLIASKNFSSFGGSGGIGIRFLDPSGDFPQGEGGTRNAFSFAVSARGVFNRTSFSFDVSGFDDPEPQSLATLELTVTPAYTYFNFDPQDSETMTQGGWGLLLGLSLGIKVGKLPPKFEVVVSGLDVETKLVEQSFGFVIKPAIGLEFPEFNPGTASFSSFMITGFIWPFPFSLTLNMGGTFNVGGG